MVLAAQIINAALLLFIIFLTWKIVRHLSHRRLGKS